MKVLSLFDGISCGRVALERAGIPVTQYLASEIDKYAIKVSRANHPDIIQLGDVHTVRLMAEAGVFGHMDLLIGGSPCFVADTKIICQDEIKSIQDVKTDDVVLTHRNIYQKVKRVGGTTKEIYKLIAQGGVPINTTEEHPFYVRKKITKWNKNKRNYDVTFTEPNWVNLKDVNIGDYVGTPILKTRKNPLKLTIDECFILGLYLGDGHTRKDYRTSEERPKDRHWQLIISIGSHEIDELKSKLTLKYSCYEHTQNVYRVVFSNKRLVEIAEKHIGDTSDNKTISKIILDLPNDLLESFLEGYEFSDGSMRNNVFRATTVSKQLVNSLSLLIAKLYKTTCCIEYTLRPNKTIIQGRVVNQKDTWTISYRKNHTKQSRAWVIDGILWNPVKSIFKTNLTEKVYNIEVENDNSYVADGRIVHNCQGFSFAGKQLAFDDPRSALFFEFVHILIALRLHNPNIRFMLENVKMKKEYLAVITQLLGVESVLIDSALVSAQSRQRHYWCNWSVAQPEDKGILLRDIIESGEVDRDKSYYIDANYFKGTSLENYLNKSRRQVVTGAAMKPHQIDNIKSLDEKSNPLLASMYKGDQNNGQTLVPIVTGAAIRGRYEVDGSTSQRLELNHLPKANAITTVGKDSVLAIKNPEKYLPAEITTDFIDPYNKKCVKGDNITYRKLTPLECERLQTLPDGYTAHVSNSQRYRQLGNGWTVDVVAHIFRSMPK